MNKEQACDGADQVETTELREGRDVYTYCGKVAEELSITTVGSNNDSGLLMSNIVGKESHTAKYHVPWRVSYIPCCGLEGWLT